MNELDAADAVSALVVVFFAMIGVIATVEHFFFGRNKP